MNLLKWNDGKGFWMGDAEKFIDYAQRHIEAVKKHGLAESIVARDRAIAGETRDAWMKVNNFYRPEISDAERDAMWARQVEWQIENVKYIERGIKRVQKEIQKARASIC